MRISSIIFATIAYTGLSFIPKPINATLIQNFELTVDGFYRPFEFELDTVSPPVGAKGFGTLVFDESQIQYNGRTENLGPFSYPYPPLGYYALTPARYSLDLLGHHYTEILNQPFYSRDRTSFSFVRTDAGGYQLQKFLFGTQDETSQFNVYHGGFSGNFSGGSAASGFQGYVVGSVRLTDAEQVPEAETIAGVPVALAFGWLSYRKLKRKRNKTTVLK